MKAHPRREFLLRALAVCGTPLFAPVMPASADWRQQAGPGADVISRAAAAYFGASIGAAQVLGEAYLRRLEAESTRASILEHATGVLEVLAAARSRKEALNALVASVRRDFQDGRIVELEGWVLSRTEAELCALTLLHV